MGYTSTQMLIPVVFGLFGLIIGSFLNVLTIREGERSTLGRSSCMSCRSTIRWYDLVPIFSWILLRGRCRDCRNPISLQYPLLEAGTGLVFTLIALAPIPLLSKVLALPIAALLLAIAVYDFRTTIIPDTWVFLCGAASLLSAVLGAMSSSLPIFSAVLGGPIAAAPL